MKNLITSIALCLGLLSTGGAHADLIAADGGQTVYDADANLYWLANANLAATNTFGVSGIRSNGRATWNTAQSWITAMNTANYLGYNDWRLPTTLQPDPTCRLQSGGDSFGINCSGSELGNLFYNELGGVAGSSILTTNNADFALFNNVQSNAYWSGTEYAPDPDDAWGFDTHSGSQGAGNKNNDLYARDVRPGQDAALPEPSTELLHAIGVLG